MSESDAALREQFSELATRWQEETAVLSSATEITSHPVYRQIIELGPRVLPLIFEELEREPAMWFAALRELTGENPVPDEERGRVQLMRATWLAWGKQHGYMKAQVKKSTDPGYPGPTNAPCMLGKENCSELVVSRVSADGQHHACLQWPRCNRTVFVPFDRFEHPL